MNNIIASVGWTLFSLISVLLLTSQATNVMGWSRDQLILLTASYSIIIGVFHCMFTRNFYEFADLIHFGELDIYLTKPIDTQFWITFRKINFTSLFRSLVGIIIIIYFLPKIKIYISFYSIIFFLFLMILSLIILYNVWFITMTIAIKYTRLSNLVDLLHTVAGIGRYPREVFEATGSFLVLLLLPVTLIATTPAKLLFGQINYMDIVISIIFCILLTFLSRKFWLYMIKNYTSAGG